jgi:hypothetical protein
MKTFLIASIVAIALNCSILFIIGRKKPVEPRWPSINTLQLEISEEVFKTYNYSNFYRWVDVLKIMESQTIARGGSNFAIRVDYDLYTFTKQPGQKTRVIYRP